MTIARRNAEKIVLYTTAYPFKIPECSLVCVYCREEFADPTAFRDHVRWHHPEVKIRVAFSHVPEGYIKVDCTDLSCRICSLSIATVDLIAEHLVKVHNKQIAMDYDLGIQPFAFREDFWSCYICNVKFSSLRTLSRHTQSHYFKYTCESCGKSYFNLSSLQHHVKFSHINGMRICVKCKKTFKTLEAKRKHVEDTPACWPFICKTCGDRFVTSTQKDAHKINVHGEQSRSYVCPECREIFPNRMKYRFHFIITHTNDYFACACGRKFDTKNSLEKHKVVHTKEKLFPCTVCSKEFSRKKNLVQHMWIHSENKRFECVPCKKKFNQKVTWKIHMKSRHPDVAIS
jgi:hypothetical protein